MTHSAPRATIEPNAKANVAKNRGSSMKDILTALGTNRPVTNSSGYGVRRAKAALSSGCESHPANAPAGKQPERAWRRRNV